MSGFRNKTAADVVNNRKAYMDNLAMEERNNDMNLQANKTYLLSGQLPPSSQMLDTRTSSEKFKDVEGIKLNIAKDLHDIAEPQFAYAIVSKVLNSPMNVNNSLFRFLAQRAKQINEQLKPMYPYKIQGDINDIEQIVNFIKNMYSNTQGNFQSVKSYINSYSSGSNQNRVMSANDIDPIITSLREIFKILNLENDKYRDRSLAGGEPHALRQRIMTSVFVLSDRILQLKFLLPTTEQLDIFLQDVESSYHHGNTHQLKALFDFLENDMPKYQDVSTLLYRGKKYLLSNNFKLFEHTIDSVKELFGFLFDDIKFGELLSLLESLKNGLNIKTNEMRNMQETQTLDFIKNQNEAEKEQSRATKVYVMNDPLNVSSDVSQPLPPAPPPTDWTDLKKGGPSFVMEDEGPSVENLRKAKKNVEGDIPEIPFSDFIDKKSNPRLGEYYNDIDSYTDRLSNQVSLRPMIDTNQSRNGNDVGSKDEGPYENYWDKIFAFIPNMPRVDMVNFLKENGKKKGDNYERYSDEMLEKMILSNVRKNEELGDKFFNEFLYENEPYFTSEHLREAEPNFYNDFLYQDPQYNDIENQYSVWGESKGKGLKNARRRSQFVGFGISEINNKSLENNIVKIRRAGSKTNYMDLPGRRVSNHVKNIVSSIVGGGMPEFEDLHKLDNEEKIYLNKLLQKADLKGRLKIPAPSKDQDEKDIHEFEVMKGQLMSGNDSRDFVKKFKLLMRRLSQKQLLARNEVRDMIEVLEDLGY